jgi:hypothetical protein
MHYPDRLVALTIQKPNFEKQSDGNLIALGTGIQNWNPEPSVSDKPSGFRPVHIGIQYEPI